MLPRQARLRARFSDRYSRISPDTWHHAVWVREMALADLRKGMPQSWVEEGGRVLSDEHFEFQGGRDAPQAMTGVERRMVHRER